MQRKHSWKSKGKSVENRLFWELRIWSRFGPDFESILAPSWLHVGNILAQFWPPWASGALPKPSWTLLGHLRTSKRSFWSILDQFGLILEPFWMLRTLFWMTRPPFWKPQAPFLDAWGPISTKCRSEIDRERSKIRSEAVRRPSHRLPPTCSVQPTDALELGPIGLRAAV